MSLSASSFEHGLTPLGVRKLSLPIGERLGSLRALTSAQLPHLGSVRLLQVRSALVQLSCTLVRFRSTLVMGEARTPGVPAFDHRTRSVLFFARLT